MAAGGRDADRPLRRLLAADVGEIDVVGGEPIEPFVDTASVSEETGMISMSSTTAASVALAVGTTTPRSFCCRAAAIAMERAPRAGRVKPSSESSPTTA